MDKQKHVWITVKKGNVGVNFKRNFYTEAFFARSDARHSAGKNRRVVKFVPENKELVKAAKEVVDVFIDIESFISLLPSERDALLQLQRALAKEDK